MAIRKPKFSPKGSKSTTPITKDQFEYILKEFEEKEDQRMAIISHLLFRCIRIGDVLKTLKKCDIYKPDGKLCEKIQFLEEKTKKLRTLPVKGERFIDALQNYYPTIENLPDTAPLFNTKKTGKKLEASGVKKLLSSFVGKRGIRQCSPHSFRKGGARYMYENKVRIEAISNVLNHHSTRVTEIYIAITPKDIEESMKCLEI